MRACRVRVDDNLNRRRVLISAADVDLFRWQRVVAFWTFDLAGKVRSLSLCWAREKHAANFVTGLRVWTFRVLILALVLEADDDHHGYRNNDQHNSGDDCLDQVRAAALSLLRCDALLLRVFAGYLHTVLIRGARWILCHPQ